MNVNASVFITEIGGVPFISEEFVPAKLLTAVACLRRNACNNRDRLLQEFLDPIVARNVYQNSFAHLPEPRSNSLVGEQEEKLHSTILNICNEVPSWKYYFQIPIRYALLLDQRTSMTCAAIPQTIYFGQSAFSPRVSLTEVVIHEHAHIWLDFICEVFNLQHDSAPTDYVLPSGTRGKTLQGILLAAHFAASCLRYYQVRSLCIDSTDQGRADFLHRYLSECLRIASLRPAFTDMGWRVYEVLQSFCSDSVQLS